MIISRPNIDSAISGRYTVSAPYKAGAGIGVLKLSTAMYDAPASFLSSAFAHIQIMVGISLSGLGKGAPATLFCLSVEHRRPQWLYRLACVQEER